MQRDQDEVNGMLEEGSALRSEVWQQDQQLWAARPVILIAKSEEKIEYGQNF